MALPTRLLLSILLVAVAATIAAGLASAGEVTPPPSGDFIITTADSPATFTGRTGIVHGSLRLELDTRLTLEDSTLIVDQDVYVELQSQLTLINTTLAFNCTPQNSNNFIVNTGAMLTVRDKDNNMSTTYDRSVLKSLTSLNFNFTGLPGSEVSIRYSHIERCGRYSPMTILPSGLTLLGDSSLVQDTTITSGAAGIVLDDLDSPRVSNCSIDSCMWGIYMRGTLNARVEDCVISQCSQVGLMIRGFHGNMLVSGIDVSDCAVGQLVVDRVTGYRNVLRDCTFGPNGQWGIKVDESESFELERCEVYSCAKGLDTFNTKASLVGVRVTDCPEGLQVDGGTPNLEDISVINGSVRILPTAMTELECKGVVVLDRVTCELSHVLRVGQFATLNVTDSTFLFSPNGPTVTGIIVEPSGTLNMSRSSATSQPTKSWYMLLNQFCNFDIRDCSFSRFGPSTVVKNKGLFVAGSGHLDSVTIEDSECGLVSGTNQAKLNNITIRRCDVALLDDGTLGRGTLEVEDIVIEDCPTLASAVNDGSIIISHSSLEISEQGFNLSRGRVNLVDSTVGAPPAGGRTAYLTDTSSLNFINSTFTVAFGWGTGENVVSVLWYLQLVLTVMEPEGAPLVGGSITIYDAQNNSVVISASTGSNGRPQRFSLRQMSYTVTGTLQGTPHRVKVSRTGLSDTFQVLMNRSRTEAFSLDNVAPSVSISHPPAMALVNSSRVTVSGSAVDTVHGQRSGMSELAYRLDGGAWDVQSPPTGVNWSVEVTVADGQHTVEVRIKDAVGNAATANVTFTVDTAPPSLAILSPEPGVTNRTRTTVIGTTSPGARVQVNGVDVTVGPSGSFSHEVDLVEGSNDVIVTASDEAGNVATVVVTLELDTTPPGVQLDPVPQRTNASVVRISGLKEAGATLYVNGDLPELTDATDFEVPIDLREGPNQISIESWDTNGNRWYTTMTVTRDSTPPKLSVVRIPDYTRVPRIVIQGTTDRGAIITVNGLAITNIDGTFSTQVDLVQGLNTIRVESRDDLFNYAPPVVYNVTLDTVPPALKITTQRQLSTDRDNATLEGTTDLGLTVRVKVTYGGAYSKTYTKVTGANGSFSFDIELPQVGMHSLTVTVEDQAGNQAQETLTFERTFPKEPDKPEPQSDWLANNWVYLVLIVSVIASVLIISIILVPSKRQKAARRRLVEARLARAREQGTAERPIEEEGEAEGPDEGWVEDEDAGEEEVTEQEAEGEGLEQTDVEREGE